MTEMDINLEARKFGKLIKETKSESTKKQRMLQLQIIKNPNVRNPARGAGCFLSEEGRAVNNNVQKPKMFKKYSGFYFEKALYIQIT